MLIFPGIQGITWSPESPGDGSTVSLCSGQDLVVPWTYLLDNGDTVGTVQWFFDGQSQEMIAIASHGHFFSEPVFGGRVDAVENAGK